MAQLKRPTIGFPSGRMGNILYKVRNNKVYISSIPFFVDNPDTQKQRKVRSIFRVCSALSSALSKIHAYGFRWRQINTGSDILKNNIHSVNYPVIKEGSGISGVILVPEENPFIVNIADHEFSSGRIRILAENIPVSIVTGRRLSVQGILELKLPFDQYQKEQIFIPVNSMDYEYTSSDLIEMEIKPGSINLEVITMYSEVNFLFNLAIKNSQGIPERFSRSIYLILK